MKFIIFYYNSLFSGLVTVVMPLFGSSKKSPVEVVKSARDALATIDKEPPGSKKAEKVGISTHEKFCSAWCLHKCFLYFVCFSVCLSVCLKMSSNFCSIVKIKSYMYMGLSFIAVIVIEALCRNIFTLLSLIIKSLKSLYNFHSEKCLKWQSKICLYNFLGFRGNLQTVWSNESDFTRNWRYESLLILEWICII